MLRLRVILAPVLLATAALAGCRTTGPPAARAAPKSYACPRATGAITIDGRTDEIAWRAAPWSDAFVDIEGDVRPRPRFDTRMRMLWDDTHLYVAARMEEPHVWGTLTRHDEIVFHDNDFEVFIDPDGDTRHYYEIEINALGTIFDLMLHRRYVDGGPADHDWDCKGLLRAVHVDGTLNDPTDVDRSWSVELAIPWSALDFDPAPAVGDTWRISFSRVQWRHEVVGGRYRRIPGRREDNWVWTPQYAINMHLPRHWGYVTFE